MIVDPFRLLANFSFFGRNHHPLSIRAGEMARVDPDEVRARYGVDPVQVPDFIALRGDPSDKLPGAPGVGPTGAATLLERYGSLEAAIAAGRFPAQAESLRLFKSIATMNRKAPLPSLHAQKPTWYQAAGSRARVGQFLTRALMSVSDRNSFRSNHPSKMHRRFSLRCWE